MSVTFNTQVNMPPAILDDVVSLQDLEKQYKKFFYAQKPLQYPENPWWIVRIYRTTSENPPIKWTPFDSSLCNTEGEVEVAFKDWLEYLSKNTNISGYKVCTMQLDMLNGTAKVASNFSKEYFKPKEKIFINGPKKKPFPTKAAKHFGG